MATGPKIQDFLLKRIDFQNDEVLAAVEAVATSAAALGKSGDNFDDANAGEVEEDVDRIGEAILTFADLFAEVGGDKRDLAKDAFGKLFAARTPEQKAAGAALFADALDFNIAANSIRDVVDGLLPDEEV